MYGHTVSQSTRLRKNALKKLSILVVSLIFAFAFVYAIPQKEAKAFPIAIPAGLTIGAGVYTLGALGLAAVIGPSSPETEERMKQHAYEVWTSATQLSKDSLNWSIEQARTAGNSLTQFGNDYLTWAESQIGAMSQLYTVIKMQEQGKVLGSAGAYFHTQGEMALGVENQSVLVNGYALKYGVTVAATTTGIAFTGHNLDGSVRNWVFINSWANTAYKDRAAFITALNSLTTAEQKQNLFKSVGVNWAFVTAEELAIYNNGVSSIKEQWESMRDAGLVLPVDSAVPLNAETGDPLTYNPDADTYTGIDGGVYTGVPTWAFPQPVKRVGEVDIPDGIYVDTPVLTGNPAYDETIIGNPAIPKTTTNINTGTTYPNPKFPTSPVKPTDPTPKPLPRIPGSGSPVPIAIFLVFFDLLRAILMYLVRMFNWIVTIPTVEPIPIDNPYFQWFRHAKILGVYPYTLVMSLATFFLGFSLVKSIRRFLP